MPHSELELELREIVRERDGIVNDEFDLCVENARIVIVEKPMDFAALAHWICPRQPELAHDAAAVADELIAREAISGTVLTPAVAIPHLMVAGTDVFELIIVKAPQGIFFSDEAPQVHAVFFIFGSADRRNRHLRALAAIAQIIQNPMFERRWDKTDTPEQLRDMLLLAKRRRHAA